MRLLVPIITLALCLSLHSFSNAQSSLLDKAQKHLCEKGLLRPEFCQDTETERDTLDLLIEMITKIELEIGEKAAVDASYDLEYYTIENYRMSVDFWSRTHPEDEYKPRHPDSLKIHQKEAVELIKTIFKEKLCTKEQRDRVLDAINADQVLHPYFALSYLAQLQVEAFVNQNNPEKIVEAALSKAASEVKRPDRSQVQKLRIDFPSEWINAGQFQQAIGASMAAAYPEAKMMQEAKWERDRLLSRCKLPMNRSAMVFAWDLGEELPIEIEINTEGDTSIFSAFELIRGDVLPYFLLQLEQNRNSPLVKILKMSPLEASDQICAMRGIRKQTLLPSSITPRVTYFFFSEELRDALSNSPVSLGMRGKMDLSKQIYRRWDGGLSTKDKLHFWRKFQKSALLDVYSPEMQRYLWVNLNSFPMLDSFEFFRQLGLGDYPANDFSQRLSWANELFTAKPGANGILRWLSDLSDNTLKPKEFGKFSAEKDKSGFTTWLSFECNGEAFHTYVNSSASAPIDIFAIEGLASAWNKTHSGEKAFYFISDTRMILFKSQAEVDKLSETMDWLIVKM